MAKRWNIGRTRSSALRRLFSSGWSWSERALRRARDEIHAKAPAPAHWHPALARSGRRAPLPPGATWHRYQRSPASPFPAAMGLPRQVLPENLPAPRRMALAQAGQHRPAGPPFGEVLSIAAPTIAPNLRPIDRAIGHFRAFHASVLGATRSCRSDRPHVLADWLNRKFNRDHLQWGVPGVTGKINWRAPNRLAKRRARRQSSPPQTRTRSSAG